MDKNCRYRLGLGFAGLDIGGKNLVTGFEASDGNRGSVSKEDLGARGEAHSAAAS
jgi:hypothetical protein